MASYLHFRVHLDIKWDQKWSNTILNPNWGHQEGSRTPQDRSAFWDADQCSRIENLQCSSRSKSHARSQFWVNRSKICLNPINFMTIPSQKKSFRSIGSLVWNVRSFQFSDANRMTENPIKWILKVCTFARFDRWWPKLFFVMEIQLSSPGFKEFIVLLLHFEISREICSSMNVLNSLLETRIFYAFRVRNGSKFLYGGWFSTIECSFKWIGAQLLSLLPLNPASEPLGKSSVATFEAYSAQKASQDFMDLWTPYPMLLTLSNNYGFIGL